MKRLISVSSFEFSTKWPSRSYINKYYRFNVNCTVLSSEIGLFNNKYLLKLEGTEENIQMFLDYLKHEGFKIR